MKRIFIFVFILLFVLSGYAEVKWNIDITEIQLDYLDFDSIDAMNQQLEKIQKNKDYIKANKSFTTLWDKNHSENYLNSTEFANFENSKFITSSQINKNIKQTNLYSDNKSLGHFAFNNLQTLPNLKIYG